MSSQLDRIEQMLRALCTHLGIQESDRQSSGVTTSFTAEDGRRYGGVVSRFEHGWGFIECEAMNRNYFVHYSDIEGTGVRFLEAGEVVSFELAPGKDGRPKAVRVRRSAARRPAESPPRISNVPKADFGNGDFLTEIEKSLPDVDDPPISGREPRMSNQAPPEGGDDHAGRDNDVTAGGEE